MIKTKYKKFIEGLSKLNMTLGDVQTYKSAGGDRGSALKKFKLCYGNRSLPSHEDACICGHPIERNFYITPTFDNMDKLLVVGSECIGLFLPKERQGKTCMYCEKPHRNRTDNICNTCRYNKSKNMSIGYCYDCNKKVIGEYRYCYECNKKKYNEYEKEFEESESSSCETSESSIIEYEYY